MEYTIITAPDVRELTDMVNARLHMGWTLVGGPIVLLERITSVCKDKGTIDEYTNGHVESKVGQALTRHSRHVTPPRQRKATPTG